MKRIFSIFLFVYLTSFIFGQEEQIKLDLASDYPRWLLTENNRTDQTSGIAYIKSESDEKYFLLADDIGKISMLTIKNDVFEIKTLIFSDSAKNFAASLPKADFEEIVYDPADNSVYVSIEGNGVYFNKYVGIYKIHFLNDKPPFKEISYFEKVEFIPTELFHKYTDKNIGYEGLTVDNNYFYLGLEGFLKNYLFADSALIFIARKSDKTIIKQISTKSFGIHTVCGLYSDKDYSLWGIDRNQRKIFHLMLDKNLDVIDFNLYDCSTQIPGYPNLNYKASFESITMDDEHNLYLVDDPWTEVFVPDQEVLEELDKKTINNFKKYVPIIFKYKITTKQGE
jgi:hypothetical protein